MSDGLANIIPDSGLGNSTHTAFGYGDINNSYGIAAGTLSASGRSWIQSRRFTYADTYDNSAANKKSTFDLLLNPLGGHVGIGTTDAASSLHIKGSTYNDTGIRFHNLENGNTSDYWMIGMRSYSDDLDGFEIGRNTGVNGGDTDGGKIFIAKNGNVGIGTGHEPQTELHVKGSGEILRLETRDGEGNNYISFYDSNSTQTIHQSDATDLNGKKARKGYIGFGGGAAPEHIAYVNDEKNGRHKFYASALNDDEDALVRNLTFQVHYTGVSIEGTASATEFIGDGSKLTNLPQQISYLRTTSSTLEKDKFHRIWFDPRVAAESHVTYLPEISVIENATEIIVKNDTEGLSLFVEKPSGGNNIDNKDIRLQLNYRDSITFISGEGIWWIKSKYLHGATASSDRA